MLHYKKISTHSAFTIVELLIVVVVIAILAAITVVSYNGITVSAKEATLKSDLASGAKQLQLAKVDLGEYPSSSTGIQKADSTTFYYSRTATSFCLQATTSQLPGKAFFVTESGVVSEGECPVEPVASGDAIQTVTTSNCPTVRTMVVDARDTHTYWVKKMADGRCWMLTNLAYAGGGTDTYSDTVNLATAAGWSYTAPLYYVHPQSNATSGSVQPSLSTDGGATNPQYGYYYNWCAAMGAQLATSACSNLGTPTPDVEVSVCPAGWRIPTGSRTSGEYGGLLAALGAISGSNTVSSPILESEVLFQRGSFRDSSSFGTTGVRGTYWTSIQSTEPTNADYFYYNSSGVSNIYMKRYGLTIRCVAI